MQLPPVVWIIDRQHWPRALTRAELLERGFEVIGFSHLAHALQAFDRGGILRPDLIVVELCELDLAPARLAALADRRVPLLALGGALELGDAWVRRVTWSATLQRPFSIGQLAERIEQLTTGCL